MYYEKFADGSVKCIEDEIPFELPKGWTWARLSMVAEAIGDGDHQPPPQTSSGIPFLVISKVSEGTLSFENTRCVCEDYYANLPETRKPRNGDLLFTVTGSYGIPVVVDTDDKFCFQRHIAIIRPCIISNHYLHIVLGSPYVKSICDEKATGTAQKTVGLATLRELLIPVAPYTEQMRIYLRTEAALNIVNSVISDKEDLQNILKITKAKILDMAIHGQLVPQDPDDEPASILLAQIREEKEALIKQGKIKRDKKESIIFRGDDNSYYGDLPENWSVTTLDSLTHSSLLNDGDWILSENMVQFGEIKLIQLGSVGSMRYVDKGFKYLTGETCDRLGCTQIYPGYMLINRIVSDKMCACILPEVAGKLITTVDTCWIAPCESWYNLKYLMYAVSSPIFQSLVMLNSAGTTRKRISKNNLISLPLAIPPIQEQYRIVGAIDRAFALLDAILCSL